MDFVEATNLTQSVSISNTTDYTQYPSASALTTSAIVNSLVESLAVQTSGQGSLLSKTVAQTITAGHTFSGDVTFSGGIGGISKEDVGLGNVENLSPANLPISSATQTALNRKVNINGSNTLTGTQNFNNNVIIGDGVGGDVMTINANISANGQTITPAQLARVNRYNVDTDLDTLLSGKADLGGLNRFTNSNAFIGDNFFVGLQTFGDHFSISDVMTINANINAGGAIITPHQLSFINRYNVDENLDILLNRRAHLAGTNNFIGDNRFYADNTYSGNDDFRSSTVLVRTYTPNDASNKVASTAYCDAQVALKIGELVGSSPEVLNTIQEISTSLNGDPSFSNTILGLLATKSGLESINTFTNLNTFSQYPRIASYTTPNNNLQMVPKQYVDSTFLMLAGNQVLTGTKTFNNVTISGNGVTTGNLTIGDATSDTLTINSTTVVNGVSLTPTQLSRVQHLDISSGLTALLNAKSNLTGGNTFQDAQTFQMHPMLSSYGIGPEQDLSLVPRRYVTDNCAFIAQPNNFTLQNTFAVYPKISSYYLPNDHLQLVPRQYVTDNFVSKSQENIITGRQNFNNNVIIGDGVGSDLMSIYANIFANGQVITPAQLARIVKYNIDTNLDTLLNAKSGLSTDNTFSGSNTFSDTNTFSGSTTFTAIPSCSIAPTTNNHLTNKSYVDSKTTLAQVLSNDSVFTGQNRFNDITQINDLVMASAGSTPATIQFLDNTTSLLGMIKMNKTDKVLTITNESDATVATVNKTGIPTATTDLVTKGHLTSVIDGLTVKPNFFVFGRSAKTIANLNLNSGVVYVNFTDSTKIRHYVNFELNFSYFWSSGNTLTRHPSDVGIHCGACYNVTYDKVGANWTGTPRLLYGDSGILSRSNHNPFSFGLVNGRPALQYNPKPTNYANTNTTSQWISMVNCSARISSSTPHTDGFSLNPSTSLQSSTGNCFFSLS